MTEAEWMACVYPEPMLEFLIGKVSDRKLRLFGAACCRRVWRLFEDDADRQAVKVAEQFADGEASEDERRVSRDASRKSDEPYFSAAFRPEPRSLTSCTSLAATLAVSGKGEVLIDEWSGRMKGGTNAVSRAAAIAKYTSDAVGIAACEQLQRAAKATLWGRIQFFAQEWFWESPEVMEHCHNRNIEKAHQATLLRDLFANLTHPVRVEAAWLSRNDNTVRKFAQAIYNERTFDNLPLLADALEESGCSDAATLAHCREKCEHVRGCWVVDLLLGKQ